MPWRAEPGQAPDPYRVWLSEIMLQQTTVTAVIPYFNRFVERFPDCAALAGATIDDVMEAWAGLGYYARARNLHACAVLVAAQGGFPSDEPSLRKLPGVGVYTAAAIASIAFGQPTVPVDGNVERVVSRLFSIAEGPPGNKPAIRQAASALGRDPAAQSRPADFTQALFDLGATICTPRAPACVLCPWNADCSAFRAGNPETLPTKAPRKVRPTRHGAHFWLEDAEGRVLLQRRPPTGLLGGMLELPGTPWRESLWSMTEALEWAPQSAHWRHLGIARHGFTHFELVLQVYAASVERIASDGLKLAASMLTESALPSVMTRCAEVVLQNKLGPAFTGR